MTMAEVSFLTVRSQTLNLHRLYLQIDNYLDRIKFLSRVHDHLGPTKKHTWTSPLINIISFFLWKSMAEVSKIWRHRTHSYVSKNSFDLNIVI